jgi:uncharacterized membrane protein YccF (DUF307 family)
MRFVLNIMWLVLAGLWLAGVVLPLGQEVVGIDEVEPVRPDPAY